MATKVINAVAAETQKIAGNDSRTQRVMAKMLLQDRGYEGQRLTQLLGRVLDQLAQ